MRSDRNKFYEDEAKENSVSFIKQTKKQQDFFDFEKKFHEAKKLIMRRWSLYILFENFCICHNLSYN